LLDSTTTEKLRNLSLTTYYGPAFCLCFCRQLLSSGQVIKNYEQEKQDSEVLPSLKKAKAKTKEKQNKNRKLT